MLSRTNYRNRLLGLLSVVLLGALIPAASAPAGAETSDPTLVMFNPDNARWSIRAADGSVDEFRQGTPYADDATLVVAKFV